MLKERSKNYETKEQIIKDIREMKMDSYAGESSFVLSNIIDASNIDAASKLINSRIKESFIGTYRDYIYSDLRESRSGSESVLPRGIFLLNGTFISVFDLVNFSEKDIFDLFEKSNILSIFHFAYAHFINRKEFEIAADVIKKFKSRDIPIALYSNRQVDYVPYLLLSDELERMSDETGRLNIIESYINSVNSEHEYYSPEIEEKYHLEIMRKYSKEIRKLKISSLDTGLGKDLNLFDLVESDPIVRENIFRSVNWDSRNLLVKMLREDKEKTLKLITIFLNQEHPNGKAKAKFLGSFSRLNRLFKEMNIEYDVFQLNEKLRGYVLLDILS